MRATVGIVMSALIAAVLMNRQDIARYLRIRRMSQGEGHPENVPARGRAAYPHD
jgi:hypothetical protein